MPMIRTEILENLDFYAPFVGEQDLVEELDSYLDSQHYNSSVVDLMLHVLANLTHTSVLVFYVIGEDVRTLLIHPSKEISQRTIYLSKVGQHYDAILDVETFSKSVMKLAVSWLSLIFSLHQLSKPLYHSITFVG